MKPQVFIKEPCFEDWNSMTSNKLGRHCSKCEKTVVDFTKWDQVDIHNYMTNNQNVCGRFQPHQLNNPTYKNYQLNYSRMFLYSSLLTTLYLKPFNLNGTVHGGATFNLTSFDFNFFSPIGKDSFGKGFPTNFLCSIVSQDTLSVNKSSLDIEIQCAEFKLKLQSDSTGNFQFTLPKGIADNATKLDVIIYFNFAKDTIKFSVYSNNINKNIILNGGQFQFDLDTKMVLVRESIYQKSNSIQFYPKSFLIGFSTLPNIPPKPIVFETSMGKVIPISEDTSSTLQKKNIAQNKLFALRKVTNNKSSKFMGIVLSGLTLFGLALASLRLVKRKRN